MLTSTRQTRHVISKGDDDESPKLAAVRVYRSQLLHFITQRQEASPHASEEAEEHLIIEMASLYQELMNCSLLTINISRSFKRACLLCIDTLGSFISYDKIHVILTQLIEDLLWPNKSLSRDQSILNPPRFLEHNATLSLDVRQDMSSEVINSIRDRSYLGLSCEKGEVKKLPPFSDEDGYAENLVHSLHEILIYAATRDILLSNWQYILQTLRLVHQTASKYQIRETLIEKYELSCDKSQDILAKSSDYESDWVVTGNTLDRSVKLCNILKIILSCIISEFLRSDSTISTDSNLTSITVEELKRLLVYVIQDVIFPTLMCPTAFTSESLSIGGIVLVQALRLNWDLFQISISQENSDIQVTTDKSIISDRLMRLVFSASFFAFMSLGRPILIKEDGDEMKQSMILSRQVQDLTLSNSEQEQDYRSDPYASFQSQLRHFASLFGSYHDSFLASQDDVERIWYPFFRNSLPVIQQIAVARGILVLDESILFYPLPLTSIPYFCSVNGDEDKYSRLPYLWMYPIGSSLLHFAQNSTDNDVRLSAVKGLCSILGRLKDRIQNISPDDMLMLRNKRRDDSSQNYNIRLNAPDQGSHLLDQTWPLEHSIPLDIAVLSQIHAFLRKCLDICFLVWESRTCKQVMYAVPDLFRLVLDLTEVVEKSCITIGRENLAENTLSVEALTKYILMQPNRRKGRYIALESLLPRLGALKLINLSEEICTGKWSMFPNDHDLMRMDSDTRALHIYSTSTFISDSMQSNEVFLLKPNLISSLFAGVCEGGNNARAVCDLLVRILSLLKTEMHDKAGIKLDCPKHENRKERRKREIKMKTDPATSSSQKNVAINSKLLPSWMQIWIGPTCLSLLQPNKYGRTQISSLFLPQISLLIGGSMYLVDMYHVFSRLLQELTDQAHLVQSITHQPLNEVLLWAKLEICIHAASQCSFRSSTPNSILNQAIRNVLGDELENALQHINTDIRLSAFRSLEYVVPALHTDVLDSFDCNQKHEASWNRIEVSYWIRFLPYSIQVAEKTYIMQLLDRAMILASKLLSESPSLFNEFVGDFMIQSLFLDKIAYPGTVSAKGEFGLQLIQHISMLTSNESAKRLTAVQQNAIHQVLISLLSDNVYSALFSLCHSSWDATRATSFQLISQLFSMNKHFNINLPTNLTSSSNMFNLKIRALHLASSPRQKETDTGARLLTLLSFVDVDFHYDLVKLLDMRLDTMQISMNYLFCRPGPSLTIVEAQKVHSLPLAHGFMLALRSRIESRQRFSPLELNKISELCHKAIEMSLIIVADVKDDVIKETDECKSQEKKWSSVLSARNSSDAPSSPLNINTGALGANTSFASVVSIDQEDSKKRILTQRIVIGTWLLTKESCATLASVIKYYPCKPPTSIVESVGYLLISVLLTLKHQGGAHAAHKALQDVCDVCYSNRTELTKLMTKDEDILEDSAVPKYDGIEMLPNKWIQVILTEISALETVRDSTLRRSTGFALGILSILKGAPRQLVSDTIKTLLILSEEQNYETRSRVHALNILKTVILDSALKPTMKTFAGDCLRSALVGYASLQWAIKNSATMMLSATMLHAVDSNKNATFSPDKSELYHGDAISLKDFHFYFPFTFRFIVDTLGLFPDRTSMVGENTLLFPCLLLLARLQPLSTANNHHVVHSLANILVPRILQCLNHPHCKVRLIASRALSVLCTDDDGIFSTTRRTLLQSCLTMIVRSCSPDWNSVHGALLAIRGLLAPTHAHTYVNDVFLETIIYYATWAGYTLECPPVCASIALDIWFHLNASSALLSSAVHRLILLIDRVMGKKFDSFTISASLLAFTSARIAVTLILHDTFVRKEYDHIESFKILLNSSWDIRLQATKSLKKALRSHLDRFQYSSDPDKSTKIKFVWKLTELLLQSFQDMCSLNDPSMISLHPPTLRRLSRCAIECLTTLQALDRVSCARHIHDYDALHHLWMSLEITATAKILNDVDISNDEISGNIIELMSFVLFSESFIRRDRDMVLLPEEASHIHFFESVIHRAMYQHGLWRVRYSVASAIGVGGINTITLVKHMIELLQDNDSDVRETAIHSFVLEKEEVTDLVDHTTEIDDFDDRTIDEKVLVPSVGTKYVDSSVLEKCYSLVSQQFSSCSRDVLLFLFHQIQQLRNDEEVNAALDEYEDYHDGCMQLNQTKPESTLMNTRSKRKIFEEEDANPYKEPLLHAHSAVFAIIKRFGPSSFGYLKRSKLVQEEATCIVETGELMLDILIRNESESIWLDLSYFNCLFGAMHAAFLGLSIVIYLNLLEEDCERYLMVKDKVSRLLQRYGIKKTLHPHMMDALVTLSTAKKECSMCKADLIRCCFLLR